MSPHQALSALRRKLTARAALLALGAVFCAVGLAAGVAQTPGKDEREVEERIPPHLPIKVKLRRPERVKDLKNEEWLGDLEVEVTNTGARPIYYLYLALSLPDVLTEDGKNIGYTLRYGRVQFWEPQTRAQPDDVPILPGESAVLKVPGDRAGAWKSLRSKGKLTSPKKLLFRFQSLSFGDGTGYWTAEGIPYPKKKEQSSNGSCGRQNGRTFTINAVINSPPGGLLELPYLSSTVSPAYFVPAISFKNEGAGGSAAAGDICCPGTPSGCSHLRQSFVTCICGEVEASASAPCTDARGVCTTTIEERETCYDSTGFEHYCDHHVITGMCGGPAPTPTPGPAPTPCDPNTPQPSGCYCDGGGSLRCCDPATRPNPYCDCPPTQVIGGGTPGWRCIHCLGSGYREADFTRYPSTGCPSNSYNDNHCCKCYNQRPSCPSGYAWDRSQCKCCNSSGQCTEAIAGGGVACVNLPRADGYCADGSLPDGNGCCASSCNPNCCTDSEGCSSGVADQEPPPVDELLGAPDSIAGGGGGGGGGCCGISPVVVDVAGDGLDLTDAEGGVRFDMRGDGRPLRISWTRAGADDAWLFLDRNGNGAVDDGRELFGNYTPQPRSTRPNGFRALAQFDKAEQGGNGDGVIDGRDAVFPSLRLWQDADHDGASDAGELKTPPALGVHSFSLHYKTSLRRDRHGNQYRYRAEVNAADRRPHAGRWAWDVFLVEAQ